MDLSAGHLMRRYGCGALILVVVVSAMAGPGLAVASSVDVSSSPQAVDNHEQAQGDGWALIFRWLNFIMLVGLLWWVLVIPPQAIQEIFSFPGLRAVLTERSESILAARTLAEQQQAEAERRLQESEERLERLEEEVAMLLEQAQADGERERQRSEQEGQALAEKVRMMARREVSGELRNAQRKLREFVAEAAVSMAGQLLEKFGEASNTHVLV
ncbi:MAG: ATP synthase F0 subunit B, partial [Acidobacteriota bacterium]